jgi:hypothetical protein
LTTCIGGGFPASVLGSFLCMIMKRMVPPSMVRRDRQQPAPYEHDDRLT